MNITLLIPDDITLKQSVIEDLLAVKTKYGIEYSITQQENDVCAQVHTIVGGCESKGVVLYVHKFNEVDRLVSSIGRSRIVLINENDIDLTEMQNSLQVITGRGEAVFKWAFRHLALIHHQRQRLHYGNHPDAFLDIWGANKESSKRPFLVILLHGGFWQHHYKLDMMAPLAASLSDQGFIVANCEYRRDRDPDFPNSTFCDVVDAILYISKLYTEFNFDTQKIIVLGHSAGGYLALKAHRLLSETGAAVLPKLYISLSGVLDIELATKLSIGDGTVQKLFVSDSDIMLRGFQNSGSNAEEIVFHGKHDTTVPVSISRQYISSPQSVAVTKYVELSDTKHMAFTDPFSQTWQYISKEIGDWVQ